MSWGKPGPRGWRDSKDEGESNQGWLRQVIHTIVEVVAGGVLRAVKSSYTDDTDAGWWLGVDDDGKAKLNIGDADQFLKWTGEQLSLRGDVTLEALLGKYDGGGVVWEDASGDPVMTIGADVDDGAITGLVIAAHDATGLAISSEGPLSLTAQSGVISMMANRVGNVADATANGDAVSRSFGDGRYLAKTAGYTGTFVTGDAKTVTVVNGQITAVA